MARALKHKSIAALLCFLALFFLHIFGQETPPDTKGSLCPDFAATQSAMAATTPPKLDATPVYGVKVVREYPHDPEAFTQGILFADGFLYESTGLNGESTVRKVELETGRVLKRHNLAQQYFGEGLARWKGTLVQLTWRSGKAFVFDLDTFALERDFSYSGEGWGLTHDGESLIMSNGTNALLFLNPNTFEEERTLAVVDRGVPVKSLNELEFIKGEIFANVWLKDFIARISPQTGEVTGWIDLSDLRKRMPAVSMAEALNGIAYDPGKDRIFVTGKLWPYVFEIQIIER